MSMDRRLWRSVIAVLLVVLTLLVATTIPDANADPKPKILPLEASPTVTPTASGPHSGGSG
jgi:hypothetical protein